MNICTLSFARCRQDERNTEYPETRQIHKVADFMALGEYDFICGVFRDGRRRTENFLRADCIGMICNNRSRGTDEYVTAKDWKDANYDFQYYCLERNDQPEPQFIVIFPLSKTYSNANDIKSLKAQILDRFPFFESSAAAVPQLFFGAAHQEVLDSSGETCIDQWLQLEEPFSALYGTQVVKEKDPESDMLNMALSAVRHCYDNGIGPFAAAPNEQEWRTRIRLINQLVEATEAAS